MGKEILFAQKLDSNRIQFEFSNFEKKILDLNLINNYPVFSFLKNESNISQFINKGSYLIWTEFEADISADTIWHLAETID